MIVKKLTNKGEKLLIHPQGKDLAIMSPSPSSFSGGWDVPSVDSSPSVHFTPDGSLTMKAVMNHTLQSYVGEPVTENLKDRIVYDINTKLNDTFYGSATASLTANDALRWNSTETSLLGGVTIKHDDVLWHTASTGTVTSVAGSVYYSTLREGSAVSTVNSHLIVNISANDGDGLYFHSQPNKESIKQDIRHLMKKNLLIRMGSLNRKMLPHNQISIAEIKARDTLRDQITERDWRRYVTSGFIMVKGNTDFFINKDGRDIKGPFWYQVFADTSRRVLVYKDNKHVHNLCIHTDSSCPPSDHVINMKMLVELEESGIWKGSNIYNPSKYNNNYSVKSAINLLYLSEKLKQAS